MRNWSMLRRLVESILQVEARRSGRPRADEGVLDRRPHSPSPRFATRGGTVAGRGSVAPGTTSTPSWFVVRVVRRVVDVQVVEPVDVVGRRERRVRQLQLLLQRGAEGVVGTFTQPASAGSRSTRWYDTPNVFATARLVRKVVVQQHAALGEEGPEVDHRAVRAPARGSSSRPTPSRRPTCPTRSAACSIVSACSSAGRGERGPVVEVALADPVDRCCSSTRARPGTRT